MAKRICVIMGVVFLFVAAWGFVTHDRVLMFHVNPAHNWVHLISGALALWAGLSTEQNAKTFSVVFGIVYGLVAIAGFIGFNPLVDLLDLNMPDNWLHLFIATVFIVAGSIQWPATTGMSGTRPTPRGPTTLFPR